MTSNKKLFILYAALALGIVAVAVFAPFIATHNPQESILTDAGQAPSGEHWFGTDRMGRDLFSRVISGPRTSLASTLALVVCTFTAGPSLRIISVYV